MYENMNPRMDAKAKAAWVAALRSGKYRQGKHQLRTESFGGYTYCCLGVACDIWGGGRWDHIDYIYGAGASAGTLPNALAARVGIDQHNPNFLRGLGYTNGDGDRQEAYASELNDLYGFTFDQIADMVDYFL